LGDLDYWITGLESQNNLPARYQGDGLFRLHRDLGVGFYLQGYFPFRSTCEGLKITCEHHDHLRLTRVETPAGQVQCLERYLPESACWAYVEHYVKSWRDLVVIRYWYEHTFYEQDYEIACRRQELIGNFGLVLCYLPKSPLMELVALLAGITVISFILVDAPQELDETLSVLRRKADEAAALALTSPAECLMIPENLSSEVIGKNLYNRYMRDYERYWTHQIKAAGKYSFIHMDGTLNGLIDEVASAGFSVLEALTPAPVGDLTIDEISERVGEKAVIWGGIPGLYFTDLVSDEQFDRHVIHMLEVMRSEPRYVLGVADQVPPGARWERIARVAELVERHGVMG
jgi:hypothetical protein